MDNIERFEQADFAARNKISSAVKSIPPPKEAAKAIAKAAPSVAKAVVAQALHAIVADHFAAGAAFVRAREPIVESVRGGDEPAVLVDEAGQREHSFKLFHRHFGGVAFGVLRASGK
jgi:DsbC/DsbD-like thiol-disulfide interchange protein